MFVQFIEGPVHDGAALRRQLDRWLEQCGDAATGWLGTTAGVTADGTGFVAARFASAEEARANSDRDEQSAWWAETEKVFDGTIAFTDCDDVQMLRGGASCRGGGSGRGWRRPDGGHPRGDAALPRSDRAVVLVAVSPLDPANPAEPA
jgi:hypothetical protein